MVDKDMLNDKLTRSLLPIEFNRKKELFKQLVDQKSEQEEIC